VNLSDNAINVLSFAATCRDEDELRFRAYFLGELLAFAREPALVEFDVREGAFETRYRIHRQNAKPILESRPKRGTTIDDFVEVNWEDPVLGRSSEPSGTAWLEAASDTRVQRGPGVG
jgi:hypothetical protein